LIHAFLGHNPLTSRLPAGDPITPVVTYPETVDLARVLAMPQWRHPTGRVPKHQLRQFRRDINNHVGIHYRPQYGGPTDPLFRWLHKRHDPRSPRHSSRPSDDR
jgi:hypothetical protein